MANKPISTKHDPQLPENWSIGDAVTPSGIDAGLSSKHGYNHLMKSVNRNAEDINKINNAFTNLVEKQDGHSLIPDTELDKLKNLSSSIEPELKKKANKRDTEIETNLKILTSNFEIFQNLSTFSAQLQTTSTVKLSFNKQLENGTTVHIRGAVINTSAGTSKPFHIDISGWKTSPVAKCDSPTIRPTLKTSSTGNTLLDLTFTNVSGNYVALAISIENFYYGTSITTLTCNGNISHSTSGLPKEIAYDDVFQFAVNNKKALVDAINGKLKTPRFTVQDSLETLVTEIKRTRGEPVKAFDSYSSNPPKNRNPRIQRYVMNYSDKSWTGNLTSMNVSFTDYQGYKLPVAETGQTIVTAYLFLDPIDQLFDMPNWKTLSIMPTVNVSNPSGRVGWALGNGIPGQSNARTWEQVFGGTPQGTQKSLPSSSDWTNTHQNVNGKYLAVFGEGGANMRFISLGVQYRG